jgi:hypothetical protein
VLGNGGPTGAVQCETNANEDHYDSYEAIAARDLGADLITTAWSGKGMYENCGGDMTETMPELYAYTLPVEMAPDWNFNSWIPDAVIINLGTNDFCNGDPGPGFESAYVAFVQTVRSYYPNAYILCTNGPMLAEPSFSQAEAYIQSVISTLAANGDMRVGYLSFGIQDGSLGYACNGHPSAATHMEMAATLETTLNADLNW